MYICIRCTFCVNFSLIFFFIFDSTESKKEWKWVSERKKFFLLCTIRRLTLCYPPLNILMKLCFVLCVMLMACANTALVLFAFFSYFSFFSPFTAREIVEENNNATVLNIFTAAVAYHYILFDLLALNFFLWIFFFGFFLLCVRHSFHIQFCARKKQIL